MISCLFIYFIFYFFLLTRLLANRRKDATRLWDLHAYDIKQTVIIQYHTPCSYLLLQFCFAFILIYL
ncbi:hypothetical protein BGX38DRAFT_1184061 [Terfezia claveryi]|nr:hypothetical protein BGX38DRAFT_1184061 [Terfezia claveryi]